MASEIKRSGEYGTPAQRGLATSVIRDGVEHPILRDGRGRVVGLAGRSRVDEHEDRLLVAEGWQKLPDLGLMLNFESLSELARLYDIRGGASIRLQFHTVASGNGSGADGWYSQEPGVNGSIEHLVNIRLGLDAERANHCIRHEYAHVSQAVLIGDGWRQAVELALDEIEAEARSMAASAEHIELVRSL
jgi:hypothetical protein